VLTPHLVELALMLGVERDEVAADLLGMARRAAREARAVVALKGAETYIAAPDGTAYRYAEGSIGLATSGSGDTLAGVVAGLLARGAEPLHAAVWAVYLHGEAGHVMSAHGRARLPGARAPGRDPSRDGAFRRLIDKWAPLQDAAGEPYVTSFRRVKPRVVTRATDLPTRLH